MIRVVWLANERGALDMVGVWAPAFFCDACGKHVEGYGNYCFAMREDRATSDVLVAHKGQCTNAIERRIGVTFGWDELTLLPDRLRLNLNLPAS